MKKRLAIIFIIIAVIIFSIAPPIKADNEVTNTISNDIVNNTALGNTVEDLQLQQDQVETQIDEKTERLEYIQSVLPDVMVQLQLINDQISEYD